MLDPRVRDTLTDLDAEFTMSLANHVMAPDIETVFLMAGEKYSHISSTLIRQIAEMGKDAGRKHLGHFIPRPVIEPLIAKSGGA